MPLLFNERNNFQKNKKILLADLILWKKISGRQIGNCRFQRQHKVEGIVVDYYCHESKLIVLLSPSHQGIILQNQIAIREMFELKGFKILQFDYDQVLNNSENVIDELKKTLLTK